MFRILAVFTIFNKLLLSLLTAQSIGEYVSHEQYDKLFRIYSSNYKVDLYFYTESIAQVRFYDEANYIFQPSYTVIADGNLPVSINVEDTADELIISTDSLRVVLNKNPMRFRYEDNQGNLLLGATEDSGQGLGVVNNKKYVRFQKPNGIGFYGTGERGMELNLDGFGFNLYNTQAFGYFNPPETMAANIPFYTTTGGYAMFFDNEYPAYLAFGKENEMISYDTEHGRINYFMIYGSTMFEQLKKYTWLTGRQPLPPKWAFGYIQSKYGYRNASEARSIVNTFRAKKIPLDVLILDLYWFNHMGDISWNTSAFPDPQGMMAEFREKGVKTVVISEPYITEYSVNYNQAASNGYLAKNEAGNPFTLGGWWSCGCNAGLLDITNPDAADWWWSKHPLYMGDNLAGFWTDLGEPESHPWEMVHHLGPANKVHNLYNLFWAKLMFDKYPEARPNERIFNLTRAGFAGIQRYGALTWSGDVGMGYTPFEAQVPIMLNSGLAGLGYEHSDLGGFCCGNSDANLYKQWVQFGVFSPIMRTHGQEAYPQEPWEYGSAIENNLKYYIELRYQLFPYLYTLAHENSLSGKPLAMPYIMYNEANQSLLNEYSGYFLGSNIAVLPNTSEHSETKYLPEGKWLYYFRTGNIIIPRVRNGGYLTAGGSGADINYYYKAGSITPMMPESQNLDDTPSNILNLLIVNHESEDAHFRLYEDDGITLEYENGHYSYTDITASAVGADKKSQLITIENDGIQFSGKPENRTINIETRISPYPKPNRVTINGYELQKYQSKELLDQAVQGYYADSSGIYGVYVKLYGSAEDQYSVVIDYDQTTSLAHVPLYTFSLGQNYPNPFNPSTFIPYSVNREGRVTLALFNILGEKVKTLVNEVKSPGEYSVKLDASGLSSGIYLYRLESGGKIISRKLTILK
ncbi:MAG: alpha-glucosidase [Melioribacteraceae bacterium]|nr:MAG: alpha-glucosidase [Melioribacteraceae bacterium]